MGGNWIIAVPDWVVQVRATSGSFPKTIDRQLLVNLASFELHNCRPMVKFSVDSSNCRRIVKTISR